MFSSLLIGLTIACNPPVEKTVPGAIKADGTLIATVNGVAIKDGIVDSLMKDIPAEQRAMIMAGPQFAQLKDQLVTTEVLYQEAIKAKIHEDPDAQLMMSLTAREVLQDFLVKKLANERMTDAKLQEWYDEHLVQFRKDSADLFMLATQEEAAANEAFEALKSGMAFPEAVEKYSIDPATKAKGGSLGNMEMTALPPQISSAVDGLTDEQNFSAPINMGPQGFMILKVENRKQSVTPFEEVKDQIKEQAMKEVAQEIVTELKDKATVEYPEAAKTEKPEEKAEEKAEEKSEAPAENTETK